MTSDMPRRTKVRCQFLHTTQRLRHGVTWRARVTALDLRSHPTRCVTSPTLTMNVRALMRTRMMSFWRNSRELLTSCRKFSPVISWNSIGNRTKQNVYYSWLAVGQSVLGRQLGDLLSNVPRRDLEPRNTCAAQPVGLSATFVPCYKHVGSMVDGIGGLECELHARIAAANRICQTLAKKLVSAKYLNCKTKVQLFRSLVLSVLLHGCGTWPEPTLAQGRRLEARRRARTRCHVVQASCLDLYYAAKRKCSFFRFFGVASSPTLQYGCETLPEPTQSQGKRLEAFQTIESRTRREDRDTLLSVGRKAPADWARMLLVDHESLRTVCPLYRNFGDPSIDWERWRALCVTPSGDGAMRPSQTSETNWREAHYISTVDLSSTFPAELPPDALMCSERPRGSVCAFTSEKARQPKPMDTEQRRETS